MNSAKRDSLRLLVLAVLFYLFFAISKHWSPVAEVNPFAEDPYDAIASAAIQLVLFLAVLSLFRTFRPYREGLPSLHQMRLIAVGHFLGSLSVCLAFLGDLVALARHAALWQGANAGRWLVAATVGFALLSVEECWRNLRALRGLDVDPEGRIGVAALICAIGLVLALAIYPEEIRHGLAGAIVTALAGMVMLLVPLGISVRSARRLRGTGSTDVVDDVIAICEGIKARTPRLSFLYVILDRIQRARWAMAVSAWINPRRHRWRLGIVAGCALGLALVFAEFWQEGAPNPSRLLLVGVVFIGIESASVLTGYGVLAEPLGLFRRA